MDKEGVLNSKVIYLMEEVIKKEIKKKL